MSIAYGHDKENNEHDSPSTRPKSLGSYGSASESGCSGSLDWKLPSNQSPRKVSPRKRMHRRNRFILAACGMCSHPMIHGENSCRRLRNHALTSLDYEHLLNMKTDTMRAENRLVFCCLNCQHSQIHLPVIETSA